MVKKCKHVNVTMDYFQLIESITVGSFSKKNLADAHFRFVTFEKEDFKQGN